MKDVQTSQCREEVNNHRVYWKGEVSGHNSPPEYGYSFLFLEVIGTKFVVSYF